MPAFFNAEAVIEQRLRDGDVGGVHEAVAEGFGSVAVGLFGVPDGGAVVILEVEPEGGQAAPDSRLVGDADLGRGDKRDGL